MPRVVRRLSWLRAFFPWMLLFVAALAMRALRFGLIFAHGGVRFPHGADELYHLRRIWFSVVNFPASLGFDPYLNHPLGAPSVWPPLFDWSIAAVARALVGAADQGAVERVAAWAPPLLGAAAVLATVWVARRAFSPAAGWVAGALLAVQPAHIFYSGLGEVDHHVAVGLFVVLLIGVTLRVAGPPAHPRRLRAAIASGFAAAAAILLWPGSLLYVGMVQAYLVVQLLATREQVGARQRAVSLAALHAAACAVLMPFCAGRSWEQFGALSPLVLSNFQPLWFGAGAVALRLVAWLWSRPSLGTDRPRRLGSAFGLAGLGLAMALVGVPGLAASLSNAAAWFEPNPFLGVVAEVQPLFPKGPFDPTLAHSSFTYLIWVYPLALACLGVRSVRARCGEVGLLLSWSAAACTLALLQQRFADVAGPAFALVLGPALVEGVRAVARHSPARRAVSIAASLLCAALAVSPSADSYRHDLLTSLAVRRGVVFQYMPRVRQRKVLERVARWLKQNTPETEGYLDPSRRPAYGVLSAWGHGHLLRYYAERPMVEDNFGPYAGGAGFEQARAYYASPDEEAGAAIADRLGVRYVVAAPQGSGQSWPRPGTLATQLALHPGGPLSAFSRHRLVFVADDSRLAREPGVPPWVVAVYELVRGARVTGRAAGIKSVTFELALPLVLGPPLRYQASATVTATGEYEIRLPHPSAAGYVVRAGARTGRLVLSEADVREGHTVIGPSFEP